jgi:uncharacterized membrane protein YesL
MAEERKKLTFENMVSLYFRNLHKIIFANLLFALPFALVGGGIYLLTKNFGFVISLILTMLTVVICYPLQAGVSKVTRDIAQEKKVNVFTNFVDAVVNNYKQFLVHSIVLYFILTIGIFSFTFYTRMARAIGGSMVVLLVAMILIAVWILFMFFYIPLMTVTFDLSVKDIYKNSALMAIGELKTNFVTLFALIILTAICSTPVILSGSSAVLIIAFSVVMLGLIYPASYTYVSGYFIRNNMMLMLTGRGDEVHSTKSAEERLRKLRQENEDELKGLDIEKVLKSNEEYIFHNGKMMKKEAILKILEERKVNNEE